MYVFHIFETFTDHQEVVSRYYVTICRRNKKRHIYRLYSVCSVVQQPIEESRI
jgi:hypothetical protein